MSARPDNDAVATSLLAALDQSIPHDDDVIISTPPLPPFDDSMDALPRHKRRYERRYRTPLLIVYLWLAHKTRNHPEHFSHHAHLFR